LNHRDKQIRGVGWIDLRKLLVEDGIDLGSFCVGQVQLLQALVDRIEIVGSERITSNSTCGDDFIVGQFELVASVIAPVLVILSVPTFQSAFTVIVPVTDPVLLNSTVS